MEGGDRFEYISLGGAVESRRPARPGPNRPPGFRMPRIGGIDSPPPRVLVVVVVVVLFPPSR